MALSLKVKPDVVELLRVLDAPAARRALKEALDAAMQLSCKRLEAEILYGTGAADFCGFARTESELKHNVAMCRIAQERDAEENIGLICKAFAVPRRMIGR